MYQHFNEVKCVVAICARKPVILKCVVAICARKPVIFKYKDGNNQSLIVLQRTAVPFAVDA